jgi:hypothetical protein
VRARSTIAPLEDIWTGPSSLTTKCALCHGLTTGMILHIMSGSMKRSQKQEIYTPRDVKIPSRLGAGILKERVIRELPSKKVISYALAYINPMIFAGDNGRSRLFSSSLYGDCYP